MTFELAKLPDHDNKHAGPTPHVTHLAFLALPYPGHINPMMALARALAARGHRITWFHFGEITSPPAPMRAIRLGDALAPAAPLARLSPIPGVRDTVHRTRLVLANLPAALAAHDIGAVVADQLDPGAGLAAAGLGLPLVSVACALLVNAEPSVPPPFVGWPYDSSPAGLARMRVAWRIHAALMSPVSRIITPWAEARGLPQRTLDDCLSPHAQISQTTAAFDWPRATPPAALHYVGRLRDPDEPGDPPPLPDGPFAFASLGTLQGHRASLFGRIAAAAAAAGLKLVLAHGGRLDAAAAAALPGDPVVRAFVPQRAVLARAALLIGHGGMNTTMDALAAGVPVVAIPLAYEQAAIAARLMRAGAGIALSRRWLTTARLTRAVRACATDPAYRAAARVQGAAVAAAGGTERAADIVERVVGRYGAETASSSAALSSAPNSIT